MVFVTTSISLVGSSLMLLLSLANAMKCAKKDDPWKKIEKMTFYEILCVKKSRNIPQDVLKKNYRKLAMSWHPDKNPENEDDANKKFARLSEAFEVLGDDEKRHQYDHGGEERLKQGGGGGGQHNGFDIFNEFFRGGGGGGFGGGGGGGRRQQQRRAEPAFDDSNAVEIELASEWDLHVTDRTEPVVVLLYNNDAALDQMADQYDKFAKGFQDFMTIAAVNCGIGATAKYCKEGNKQTKTPAVAYYSEDQNKERVMFSGSITNKKLGNWLSKTMTDHSLQITTMDQMVSYLHDTSLAGPRIVLFSDKKTVPPRIKALSRVFSKRAAFAVWTGAHSHAKASAIAGGKFPVVMYIDNYTEMKGEKFTGDIGSQDTLRDWVQAKVTEHRKKAGRYGITSGDFQELTAQRYQNGECNAKDSSWCFVVFSSNGDGSELSDPHTQLAAKYKNDPCKFVWLTEHPDLLKPFALKPSSGDPTLVAYRPKRNKYRIFEGKHTFSDLDGFVESVMNGGPSGLLKVEQPLVVKSIHAGTAGRTEL